MLLLLLIITLLAGALPVAATASRVPPSPSPPALAATAHRLTTSSLLLAISSTSKEYRTVEAIHQVLDTMATHYPHLAHVETIGHSWRYQQTDGIEGYPLRAITITNADTPGPKPVFTLIAAIHAREMMSAEVAIRFISFLLLNYGIDPDITWILDEHTIVVIPMVNPDGHKLAEQGYMQRKNINDSAHGPCAYPPVTNSHDGVDLNRNFAYRWGSIDRPDVGPCHQTFPGTSAASEPETSAIQAYVRTRYPDHPRPSSGTPAPPDTSGVLISLHSYGEAVLWPWGYTSQPAPNAEGLARLGKSLADRSGYRGIQANAFYPTSGTVEDWSYATLGIPSYTMEIGLGPRDDALCGGFMPPLTCLDTAGAGGFWSQAMPALRYAARVARHPYTQPAGPHIEAIEVVSDTQVLTLTADVDGGTMPITATELFIAQSPWRGGTPYPMTATDGVFDSAREVVQIVLPRAEVMQFPQNEGHTLLLLRGQNRAGVWGPIQATWFPPRHDAPPVPQVQAVEAVQEGDVLRVQAVFDGGYEPVTAAHLSITPAPDPTTTALPLHASDGIFDTAHETGTIAIPLDTLWEAGPTSTETTLQLTVRGQSGERWGPPETLEVTPGMRGETPATALWLPAVRN